MLLVTTQSWRSQKQVFLSSEVTDPLPEDMFGMVWGAPCVVSPAEWHRGSEKSEWIPNSLSQPEKTSPSARRPGRPSLVPPLWLCVRASVAEDSWLADRGRVSAYMKVSGFMHVWSWEVRGQAMVHIKPGCSLANRKGGHCPYAVFTQSNTHIKVHTFMWHTSVPSHVLTGTCLTLDKHTHTHTHGSTHWSQTTVVNIIFTELSEESGTDFQRLCWWRQAWSLHTLV